MEGGSSRSRREIEASLRAHLGDLKRPERLDRDGADYLKSLLAAHPELAEWSTKPRLFAVMWYLRWWDDRSRLDPFRVEQAGDYVLPVDQSFARDVFALDGQLWDDFCVAQINVLSHIKQLGEHLRNAREGKYSPEHFLFDDLRAQGLFPEQHTFHRRHGTKVSKVHHASTRQTFAMKSIWKGSSAEDRAVAFKEFENERDALARVNHKHVIKCIATFTDRTNYSFLLSPLCEYDLSRVLEAGRYQGLSSVDKLCVRHAFGCLATSMEYLHAEARVRHKDIKPGNILIKDSHLYLCDFGVARVFLDSTGGTTGGDVGPFTHRYCAPEVIDKDDRNKSSDIWSLGCVFMELISAMKGKTPAEMNSFIERKGADSRMFWACEEILPLWADEIRSDDPKEDAPLDWALHMIQKDPTQRPRARELVDWIEKHREKYGSEFGFIGNCCGVNSPSVAPSTPPTSPSVRSPPLVPRETMQALETAPISPTSGRADGVAARPSFALSIPRSQADSRPRSARTHASEDSEPISYLGRAPSSHPSYPSPPSPRSSFTVPRSSLTLAEPPEVPEVFHTSISEYHVLDGGESFIVTPCDDSRGCNVQVSEDVHKDFWRSTRRLVIEYPVKGSDQYQMTEIWLPLTDIQISVDVDMVDLKWSDCNQIRSRRPGDHSVRYDRVYNADRPNNRIHIKFLNTPAVSSFVDKLRFLREGAISARNRMHIRVSAERLIGIYNCTKYRAMIIMESRTDSNTHIEHFSSSLFLVYRDLDLKWRAAGALGQYRLNIENLRSPSYRSDVYDRPTSEDIGNFQETLLVRTEAPLEFTVESRPAIVSPPKKGAALLRGITGWTLVLFTTHASLTHHKRFKNHKYGNVELMLWRRGGLLDDAGFDSGGATAKMCGRLTFRLRKETDRPWLTGEVLAQNPVVHSTGVTARVKILNPTRGTLLNVTQMVGAPADGSSSSSSSSSAHPAHPDANSAADSTIEYDIDFQDEEARGDFVSKVESFAREMDAANAGVSPYGAGVSSSGGGGVGAGAGAGTSIYAGAGASITSRTGLNMVRTRTRNDSAAGTIGSSSRHARGSEGGESSSDSMRKLTSRTISID